MKMSFLVEIGAYNHTTQYTTSKTQKQAKSNIILRILKIVVIFG
jgi:hypothetical protein